MGLTLVIPSICQEWLHISIWPVFDLHYYFVQLLFLCKQPASFKWNGNLTVLILFFLTFPILRCSESIKKNSVIP